MTEIRETAVERHLVRCVELLGGKCVKLAVTHWPDRIILLPGGVVGFLELKRPGKAPTDEQWERMNQLEAMGMVVAWTQSKTGVEAFVGRLAAKGPLKAFKRPQAVLEPRKGQILRKAR